MSVEQPDRALLTKAGLVTPLSTKLAGKRIVLASSSPRRKDIFEQCFGFQPEIVASTFAEDLSHSDFAHDPGQYSVATATEKAVEVYIRLVTEHPEDPPDLVIGADSTVIYDDIILEKPGTKEENMRMLLELNGRRHQVCTGVTIVEPQLAAPGYSVRSLMETTYIHFAENSTQLLRAYVENGEGVDRAGGYAIQGLGSVLIQRIEGDFHNAVGFPAFAFYKFMSDLLHDGDLLADA